MTRRVFGGYRPRKTDLKLEKPDVWEPNRKSEDLDKNLKGTKINDDNDVNMDLVEVNKLESEVFEGILTKEGNVRAKVEISGVVKEVIYPVQYSYYNPQNIIEVGDAVIAVRDGYNTRVIGKIV